MKNPNPDPAKHQEIAIWNAENWLYEDFEAGKRARSIRRTISEGGKHVIQCHGPRHAPLRRG